MGQKKTNPVLDDLKASFKHLRALSRLGLMGAALIWVLSGFYVVQSDEQGVVRRFGRMVRGVVSPGMHYHLPWPIEKVDRPKVRKIRRASIGYVRESGGEGEKAGAAIVQRLTGDINIIDLRIMLQYSIKDASDYLFGTENPDYLVKVAAEAAITQILGGMPVDEVLTIGKIEIQNQTQRIVQEFLDNYGCGILILTTNLQEIHPPKDVIKAFKDVINAQADRDKFISEAHAFENLILPKARGEAEALIKSAEAYREEKINRSLGESSRFLKVLEAYQKAPEVSRDRLYLETMERIGPRIRKWIISPRLNERLMKIYGIGE
ncbi:MAG: FtsH protease activity modulator HflK [Deltaproteobacteria bacterium]|nr:FtsH protease activity modulator HflK [Deltaproteobacteria bacterium]